MMQSLEGKVSGRTPVIVEICQAECTQFVARVVKKGVVVIGNEHPNLAIVGDRLHFARLAKLFARDVHQEGNI